MGTKIIKNKKNKRRVKESYNGAVDQNGCHWEGRFFDQKKEI